MNESQVAPWQDETNDMPAEEFRRLGHEVVDWLASYYEHLDEYPVLSRVTPGEIAARLPPAAPVRPEPMNDVLRDFETVVLPGITHWNHPAFYAYFAITGSGPGVLAEMLASGLNVNAMLWRTSPAATELETVTLDWLRQLVGLPSAFEGVIYDTASISTMVAVAAAREAQGLDIRRRGMAGRTDLPPLTMYCSEQSHSSVEKAGITLGIGQENVRKIATDNAFRMNADLLAQAIATDRAAGKIPFCIVATVGTTATTSIDPVPEIAEIASRGDLWLHVDAAYGGAAAIAPEMRWVMDGVDRADSVVINPHKWLFTPVDCSAFFCRRLDLVQEAFTLVPAYLRTPEDEAVRNFMNYGPQLGRRFRALKLWFVLRAFGQEGIQRRILEHIRYARMVEQWIRQSSDWEMVAPAPFSTLCFRACPSGLSEADVDSLNVAIESAINAGGQAFLAHTVLNGRVVLRMAIGNLHTEERHVRQTWELLQSALEESRASS